MMEKLFMGTGYLADGICIGTPVFIIYCVIQYLRTKKNRLRYPGWITQYIFCIYAVTVGMITRIFNISEWAFQFSMSWNLVPFVNESWELIFLNSLMLLPMGLFFPVIIKKTDWKLWKMTVIVNLVFVH